MNSNMTQFHWLQTKSISRTIWKRLILYDVVLTQLSCFECWQNKWNSCGFSEEWQSRKHIYLSLNAQRHSLEWWLPLLLFGRLTSMFVPFSMFEVYSLFLPYLFPDDSLVAHLMVFSFLVYHLFPLDVSFMNLESCFFNVHIHVR